MTSFPLQDTVAIDTNVFEHLLNREINYDSHINRLLVHLFMEGSCLIVDKEGRIPNEYNHRLGRRIESLDEKGNERFILRYWMELAPRHMIQVSGRDNLMNAIRRVIIERPEATDRIFVYVAFKEGITLISNDVLHVVFGPDGESGQQPRRHRLLSGTRRWRPNGAAILTSKEASDAI